MQSGCIERPRDGGNRPGSWPTVEESTWTSVHVSAALAPSHAMRARCAASVRMSAATRRSMRRARRTGGTSGTWRGTGAAIDQSVMRRASRRRSATHTANTPRGALRRSTPGRSVVVTTAGRRGSANGGRSRRPALRTGSARSPRRSSRSTSGSCRPTGSSPSALGVAGVPMLNRGRCAHV